MKKYTVWSVIYLALFALIGLYTLGGLSSFKSQTPFVLGLDLAGGTELIYTANVTNVPENEIGDRMSSLKEVIERRVDIYGVSEPLVQVEQAGVISGNPDHRLIVELPSVTDIEEAVAQIGKTPLLEFKLVEEALQEETDPNAEPVFIDTGLTGRLVSRAQVSFQGGTQGGGGPSEPVVIVNFDSEGAALFEKITGEHVGEPLAIFLDGALLSAPTINEKIVGGEAVISGGFDLEEAKTLSRDLNFGKLPLPISLTSSQVIGPTLGASTLSVGIMAGLWSLALISLFLILWYRVPGAAAALALCAYVVLTLALLKFIPVTLTAAGLAGLVMSIGTAIDGNILIFERMKEELARGKKVSEAIEEGFSRAWPGIRDSNFSGIIIAVILFWVGTAGVKGFALTLGLGTLVSMLSSISVSRIFLRSALEIVGEKRNLFLNGLTK